ncbi:MAG: N-acetylmuramoyl-L-alanine amidase [candidate division Zixibacteria bacterium]|nr:N-acetylmuramoyl-L-alanine amidase [candidate division Zixibacteria bacterium]
MRKIILAITLVAAMLGSATPAAAVEIKVKTSGGTEKIEGFDSGQWTYLNLCELSDIIGAKIEWRKIGYSAVLTVDGHHFRFTVESPYVNCDGEVNSLVLPAKLIKGALFVPAESFAPLLDKARQENIVWDPGAQMLRIDTEYFNITDLAINPKENGTLIEVFTSDSVQYQIYQTEGNWLNIEFPGGKINRTKIMAVNSPAVIKIDAFQFENSAQLAIQLRKGFSKFRQSYKTDPRRLQIAIEDESFVPDSTAAGLTTRIGPDDKVDIIVVDAGHGGKEYGAIGRKWGTREKDITLDIARELAKLLRKDNTFKVIMTRNKDEVVPLNTRAKIANDARADMFVSIHCNASTKKTAHGFQVFYLAPAKNDSARAVAQAENAPFLVDDPSLKTSGDGDLAVILNDMIQTEFLAESADLAYMMDMEMRKNITLKSRGVDHAGFVVLNRVYMPSNLVETAFISNVDEEKLLRSKDFRKKSAQAIYNAIKRFQAKYEGK